MHQAPITGQIGISGSFESRDADGNILKVIDFKGTLPLSSLQPETENDDGADDSE